MARSDAPGSKKIENAFTGETILITARPERFELPTARFLVVASGWFFGKLSCTLGYYHTWELTRGPNVNRVRDVHGVIQRSPLH